MPHCPASCWADSDTSGSHPLIIPLYYTAPGATDLDHILTILGPIVTGMVRIGPSWAEYRENRCCGDAVAARCTLARKRAIGVQKIGFIPHIRVMTHAYGCQTLPRGGGDAGTDALGARRPNACLLLHSGLLLAHRPVLLWAFDSNRTILVAKELHLITQTVVRRLINPIFDATLCKARHNRPNDGPHAS
jgi:hypothetical protein